MGYRDDLINRLQQDGLGLEIYIRLLREHIQKEDHRLFPADDQELDDDDEQNLMAAFERVETDEIGRETHEKYLNIANRLADHFDVPRSAASADVHATH